MGNSAAGTIEIKPAAIGDALATARDDTAGGLSHEGLVRVAERVLGRCENTTGFGLAAAALLLAGVPGIDQSEHQVWQTGVLVFFALISLGSALLAEHAAVKWRAVLDKDDLSTVVPRRGWFSHLFTRVPSRTTTEAPQPETGEAPSRS
ncbi:hypothetical protein [Rathayibacter sp. AY1B8]|uniref:hypothetical protein n=1 Tax=Rathayibacter sp. AY1B8 TaxID=2080533 RepID=UPI0011B02186|nr:hypothetical protein [Rathayibacter sp. AY1B8]